MSGELLDLFDNQCALGDSGFNGRFGFLDLLFGEFGDCALKCLEPGCE